MSQSILKQVTEKLHELLVKLHEITGQFFWMVIFQANL